MNLQELLGVAVPIIQAPMAGVQGSELAIAVSNAGGLGSLPCAMLAPEDMQRELVAICEQTDRPYNVNFFCHQQAYPDAQQDSAWLTSLAPYYQELGLSTEAFSGVGRKPFDSEIADILADFKPPVVSFHFGLPSPALLERVHSWGSKVLSSATTVDEAIWLEANGADAVIAQGLEAGGHRAMFLSDNIASQVGTLSLVPQVVEAIDIPVIAAGGIADARGVAAVMLLGASGAQLGTAYLLCPEAATSEVHRKALKGDAAGETAITNVFTGRPARSIVNRIISELGPISANTPAFPRAAAAVAPLRKMTESLGSGEFSPLWAGQNTSGCKEVAAGVLTRELAGAIL